MDCHDASAVGKLSLEGVDDGSGNGVAPKLIRHLGPAPSKAERRTLCDPVDISQDHFGGFLFCIRGGSSAQDRLTIAEWCLQKIVADDARQQRPDPRREAALAEWKRLVNEQWQRFAQTGGDFVQQLDAMPDAGAAGTWERADGQEYGEVLAFSRSTKFDKVVRPGA